MADPRAQPARVSLASALATLEEIGRSELPAALGLYADAADELAHRDVDDLLSLQGEDVRAEAVIATAVLGDAVLSALRRLAEEFVLAEPAFHRVTPSPDRRARRAWSTGCQWLLRVRRAVSTTTAAEHGCAAVSPCLVASRKPSLT